MEYVAISSQWAKRPSFAGLPCQKRSAGCRGRGRKSCRAAATPTYSEFSSSVPALSTGISAVSPLPHERTSMLTGPLRGQRMRLVPRNMSTLASWLQYTTLVRIPLTMRNKLPQPHQWTGSEQRGSGLPFVHRVGRRDNYMQFFRRGHASRFSCTSTFSSGTPRWQSAHPRLRLDCLKASVTAVRRSSRSLPPAFAKTRHREDCWKYQPQSWVRTGLETRTPVPSDRAPLWTTLSSSHHRSSIAASLSSQLHAPASASGSVTGCHSRALSTPHPNCFLALIHGFPFAPGCWSSTPVTAMKGTRRFFSSRFRRPLPFSAKPQQPLRPPQQQSRPDESQGPSPKSREAPSTPPTRPLERVSKSALQTRLHRGPPGAVTSPRMDVRSLQQPSKEDRSPSFEQQFLNDKLLGQNTLQFTKVSEKGTADALFAECLESIRHRRFKLDPDVDNRSSEAVEKLTQEERAIAEKIFQRVDPERKIAPRLESRGCYIDPLWDPFKRVEELQQQVAQDLTEYAKLVGAAEARRQRLLVRASLRRQYRMHDPLSEGHRRFFGAQRADPFPTPHRVHERFWDPSPDVRVALKNNNVPISWRDLHILHHFVGENGLILPRRTTHASRYQQRCIFKAICMARRMALFPYDWKPTQGELMPVMDPLQYLVDELTSRYKATGDLRADAMLCVMLSKYPKLNYFRYLQYKAQTQKSEVEAMQQQEEEDRGDFSRLLRKYKRATTDQDSRYRPTTSA
ncbi:ribosomal protein S18, putative [Toxoplasma gondii ME49]|uniref:Ribosomal protein S18, putative n=2 Tax=Toxoplasma gondii TaxID=5811 RepID=S8F879_TOXGM|nr:ribosomal protein S18, putative [Toxoplasma gondii ME49]EPT32106.1 ribosomal protein S18, putative [Toxoplasma gondii ME49]KYF42546.1 putative ribosomal protein S18 [Toxoplasma gondii ARI]|eukprot:XP_002370086.2 ribosomal protein S18, putative [Toxoplasma gondii ME49]